MVLPLARRAGLGLQLHEDLEPGPVVETVVPEQTAASAGVHTQDRLVAINGHPVGTVADVQHVVRQLRAGQLVTFWVLRAGDRLQLQAPARAMPLEQIAGAEVVLDHVDVAGLRLRTIYTWPTGSRACPAVLLLPDKSCRSCEHPLDPGHPQLELVARFTAKGWATYRVERSGLGDSEGPPCSHTPLDLEIAGFRAGLRQLCAHPVVEKKCIYIYGHSLGGIEAPLVARGIDVAGIVTFGATATSWSASVVASARRHGIAAGAKGPAFVRGLLLLQELLSRVLTRDQHPGEVLAQEPRFRAVAKAAKIDGELVHGRIPAFFRQLEGTDLHSVWHSLRATAATTGRPRVLALHGTGDLVTGPEDAVEIATAAGGQSRELVDVDHYLRSPQHDALDKLFAAIDRWLADSPRARPDFSPEASFRRADK